MYVKIRKLILHQVFIEWVTGDMLTIKGESWRKKDGTYFWGVGLLLFGWDSYFLYKGSPGLLILKSWWEPCYKPFHPYRPIQIPLQTVQLQMRRLETSRLIRIYTCLLRLIYWFLTETHIYNNECVQIQRWLSPFHKLTCERFKQNLKQNS